MIQALFVGLGGFVGAVSRYGLTALMKRLAGAEFPYGTLVANVLGCLAIGALFSLVEDPLEYPNGRAFLVIGPLGGFTTFSSFGHETLSLFSRGQLGAALGNVALNMILCLGAVMLGRMAVGAGQPIG